MLRRVRAAAGVAGEEELDPDLDLVVAARAECREAVAPVREALGRVEELEQLVTQAVCGKAPVAARARAVD